MFLMTMQRINEMLEIEQVMTLSERLITFFSDDKLLEIITKLNRLGNLEDFLNLIGAENLLDEDQGYRPSPSGYIVVLGASEVKDEMLISVGKKLGIDKSKFKFITSYESAKKFEIGTMQYNSNFAAVICGPMPHKCSSTGDYNSVISRLEQEGGYPPVKKLGERELHISKSNFKKALEELIQEHKIQTN